MNAHDQPGLFDIPEASSTEPPARTTRGTNRQTWTRVATADVVVTDADALRAAAARAETGAVTLDLDLDAGADGEDDAASGEIAGSDVFDALAWLIWPTDGLEVLLEAGAVQVLSVESAVEVHSAERGALTWTVTVKLRDVNELRRLAAQAHPEEAAEVASSLSAAWRCAADPFAPLASIPGIRWQPGPVEVQHVPKCQRSR